MVAATVAALRLSMVVHHSSTWWWMVMQMWVRRVPLLDLGKEAHRWIIHRQRRLLCSQNSSAITAQCLTVSSKSSLVGISEFLIGNKVDRSHRVGVQMPLTMEHWIISKLWMLVMFRVKWIAFMVIQWCPTLEVKEWKSRYVWDQWWFMKTAEEMRVLWTLLIISMPCFLSRLVQKAFDSTLFLTKRQNKVMFLTVAVYM